MGDSLLPRFNLALVPLQPAILQQFFAVASFFAPVADGYLLAPGRSIPHTTVCQFRAINEANAREIVKEFLPKKFVLNNFGICFRKGTAEHRGKYWLEYMVRRTEDLMRFQANTVTHLETAAAETFTRSGPAYNPHFSLARVPRILNNLSEAFLESLLLLDIECELCVGESDENGQLLRIR